MLHTRATALRHSSRASRYFFLSMAGAAMLATVAACGSDNSTAPQTPAVVGDYTLQSIDGKVPPDTVVHTSTVTVVFVDGLLSLHSDMSYRLLFHSTTTPNGGATVADSSGSTGTYSVHGTTVVIRSGASGDSVVATTALPSISFTDGGEVFVFSRAP